jgi:telomere length regulation protein
LLVVAGYLYRLDPTFVSAESKASTYINAISNRLSASSQRASILGMLVGTAISALADADGKRMNFSAEEVDSADGRWYQSLTSVQDPVGSISDLRSTESKTVDHPKKNHWKTTNVKPQRLFDKQSSSKIIAIEEIHGESESEDDNLIAYEKPDSDASDEDEDADLVQRNKPTAPV